MANESEVPPSDWLPEPPTPRGGAAEVEQSERPPYQKILVVYGSVLATGMGLAWAFLAMRAVAGVGGSCGSDGTYVAAAPCPDGSWLIAIAIPLMLIAMFVGSGVGMTIGAPALLLPMWGLLFGSLGWNFLEFGFGFGANEVDVSLIVCGVLFWAMALPAWWAMAVALKNNVRQKLGLDKPEKVSKKVAKERAAMWRRGSLEGSLWWWLIYTVLLAGGALFGTAVYAAAA